jgi:uncharacterized glyoxalase superfamily protein PhnB
MLASSLLMATAKHRALDYQWSESSIRYGHVESLQLSTRRFSYLTTRLTVNGAATYIEFLLQAFDAVELTRSTASDGRLLNASVRIGDSVMMLNDAVPEFRAKPILSPSNGRSLTLYVSHADSAWAKALATGCTVIFSLRDQFWGDCGASTSACA